MYMYVYNYIHVHVCTVRRPTRSLCCCCSPSGCTFWGKKPWSRKKKILWQLGTLVGAPVGIALLAGIAIPAMIIGIPVWVGRKLYIKYEHRPRHRRNLLIAGGVITAIFVSPVMAALAVGKYRMWLSQCVGVGDTYSDWLLSGRHSG